MNTIFNGFKFRCPTREDCALIYDARFHGLDDALEIIGGDNLDRWIWTNETDHVNVFLPILEWTDDDVEQFIVAENIKVHPLYYGDWGRLDVSRRLGCIGCPMKSDNGLSDFKKYPKMARAWIKAGQKWLDTHPNVACHQKFNNACELFAHNVFFNTYDAFDISRGGGLFEELKIDYTEFLQQYFKIEL